MQANPRLALADTSGTYWPATSASTLCLAGHSSTLIAQPIPHCGLGKAVQSPAYLMQEAHMCSKTEQSM
jgi:hypothetical protein